jgi:hypothetical protein
MNRYVGWLAGALLGVGAWAAAVTAAPRLAPAEAWRAGAPDPGDDESAPPLFEKVRAPGSEPGSEGDERQIRPPVQRGPDDFYRKPPRERKPRDRMYA